MTRKLTRSTSVLRGSAPFIAVLILMISLAALAQMTGTKQATGKHVASLPESSWIRPEATPLDSGAPLFLPALTFSSGGFFGRSVAVGDFNGDGKPDLLVGNQCNNQVCAVGAVEVLLGLGDGTFRGVGTYGTQGEGAKVAVGDVNGDGKLDMLAADICNLNDCSTGVITVRTGNGDGTFAGGTNVFGSGGTQPVSIAVADVNGDGKLDLIVANCSNGCTTSMGLVGVLLGNGDATFQTAVTYSSGAVGAASVVVADVNGDGKPDLVVANRAGSVGVLLGKGDGTFQPVVTYNSGGSAPEFVAVADVNGDGKLDLLVSNSTSNTVGVLLGKGDGTFQPAVTYNSGGLETASVAVADVNGDGRPDVLVVSGCNGGCTSGLLGVLLGNGDGTFQAAVVFDTGGVGGNSIAIADVNGDGRPDAIVANTCFNNNPNCPNGSVGVLLNDTGPHSPTTTALVSNVNPAAVGQLVIYTATVANQSGGPLTGTVAFQHGRSMTTVPLVGNQAMYKVSYKGGTHPITATYSGDADNATSTSIPLIEYVGLALTKTVLTTSGSPSHVGQTVTFTAAVTWTYGTVPNGELVTFFDGTTTIGTGTTAGGMATFSTASLTAKTHTIKATYAGDATFKASSGKVTQVVQP
jgi:hypothetical protein